MSDRHQPNSDVATEMRQGRQDETPDPLQETALSMSTKCTSAPAGPRLQHLAHLHRHLCLRQRVQPRPLLLRQPVPWPLHLHYLGAAVSRAPQQQVGHATCAASVAAQRQGHTRKQQALSACSYHQCTSPALRPHTVSQSSSAWPVWDHASSAQEHTAPPPAPHLPSPSGPLPAGGTPR